ncbi:MAG: HTH-type transcriptional repressor KstR2 [Bacteroidetes bacterium ADurb.Bin145]|nr:MAG: HTH-type transcriptional repressor KstR2 [Bacteroidetes bacterium ADurb.Bin145]
MDYRQKIIEAAALMFRTYGIRAVTMDMLANELGISKRTIYEKFRDKDELLAGVLKWMAVKQKEAVVKVFGESENVIAAIFRLFDMMCEHFQNMSPAFRLDMEKYYNNIVKNLIESGELPYSANNIDMLKRGIKEGIFRKDIDIDLINQCLNEVLRMPGEKDIYRSENNSNRNIFRDFYVNYLRGISTQKGLELINYYNRKLTM